MSGMFGVSLADRADAQAQEARRARLSWLAVSLVDGVPVCDLPWMRTDTLEYHLMESTTQQLHLPFDHLPVNWEDATVPGGVAYILLQDETPIWGGLLVGVHSDLSGTGLDLKVDTVETYLERCPTGDLLYRGQEQTRIVSDIVTRGAVNGMRNCIMARSDSSGTRRDREYKDTDDKSVLSAIQELACVRGGPEWGHWWERADDGSYRCVITARDHYGSEDPVTDFDVSRMTGFSLDLDASGTALANRVRAVSTAEGDVRPTSSWVEYKDPARPVWPLSFTPSTSITDVGTLEAHARRRLDSRRTGTVTHSIDLDLLTAPRLGVEWRPGDVVRWDAGDSAQVMPGDTAGMARVIGYKVGFTGSWTLTPILQEGAVDNEQ